MGLTELQRTAIQTTERVGASLSLVGVVLIFITYAAFKRLRTVPNTFILFASIANVGASIACLIGYAGLTAGDQSPLCQVQAFLLEMLVIYMRLVFLLLYFPSIRLFEPFSSPLNIYSFANLTL